MTAYLPILILFVVAFGFVFSSVVMSLFVAPQRPHAAKQAPYECGIVPEGEPAERFPVKFYLVAMAFIVLDVEIIFLFPFATVFRSLSVYGLTVMGVFLLVLLVPFAYLLSTGALEWGPVKELGSRAAAAVQRTSKLPERMNPKDYPAPATSDEAAAV